MAAAQASDDVKSLIRQTYERVHSGNHYEVLGISRTANDVEVKKSYFQMAKKFHPDSFSGQDLGDLKPKLDEIFAKVTNAYNLLADPERRRHYNDVLDGKVMDEEKAIEEANRAIKAELDFQKGEICIRAGNFDEAEGYFRNAVKVKPEEADFWAYLGWSVYKKRVGDQNVNRLKGKTYLKKALEVKSGCDKALTFMGYIAKIEEKPAIAFDLFRRALAANPENKEAAREVKAFENQAARVLGQTPGAAAPAAEKEEAKPAEEAAAPKPSLRGGKVDLQAALSQLKRREK